MAGARCPSGPIVGRHHPPRPPQEGQGAGRRRWPPVERLEVAAAPPSSSSPPPLLRWLGVPPDTASAPPSCRSDHPRRRGGPEAAGDQPLMEREEAEGSPPPAPWPWNQQQSGERLLFRGCASVAAGSPPSAPHRRHRHRRPKLLLAAALSCCCAALALYAAAGNLQQEQLLPVYETRGEDEEALTVLLWWEPFAGRHSLSSASSSGRGECWRRFNISGCRLSTNRSHQLEAHAVLFHHRDLRLQGRSRMPRLRAPGQLWVWMNFESPSNSHGLQELGGIFNWTMSYRVDSDVFVPYGYLRPSHQPQQVALPRKNKLVAWVISNWNEGQDRVRYYHLLKDHLPIDVYGTHGLELKDDNVVKTVSEYKFYLAFENSLHPDYITEKLWRNAFASWTVPVVLGPSRSNYELFIPSDSFIHVDDFSSPIELAIYLKFLDKNKSRYKRYFAWRKHYDVHITSFWDEHCCRVCDAIRTMGKQRKTIENLANWFES